MNYAIIVSLTFLLGSTACGQTASNINKVTKAQYNNISKEVKTYPYNPTYCLRLLTAACTYEIYINDVLVDHNFNTGNATGIVPFPELICKSGKQKIRIQIYPSAVEDGELSLTLVDGAKFDAEIFHEDYANHKETSVMKLSLPSNTKPDGLPYFELNSEFDAKVPYVLQGWSDAVDLRKEEPKRLVAEILGIYERYRVAYEHSDVSVIVSMIYDREKATAQALYLTSGKANSYDNGWEELEREVASIKAMQPINDYTLRYFGDGRVVALLKTSGRLRDFSAIYGETNDEKLTFYGLFLYRPKPGAPLEVIR